MDVQEIVGILRGHIVGGMLSVSGSALQSADIEAVFGAYLPDSTLVLTDVPGVQDNGANAQVTGTGSAGGPFAGMAVTATFTAPDQTAEIDLVAAAPAGWSWSQSFPELANTLLPALTFTDASFELASLPPSPATPGLTFTGTVDLGAELAVLAWLLAGSSSLTVTGPVGMDGGIPLPDLSANVATACNLTLFTLPYVKFLVGASLVPATGTASASPLGYVGLATEIDFNAAGTQLQIPLSATFGLNPTSVVLFVDLTEVGQKIDAALTDLAGLLGGQNFSSYLAGIPLSSLLTLRSMAMQIDLVEHSIEAVRVTVGSTESWTIISEQSAESPSTALFAIEDVEVVLALNPPTCSQPGVAVFGTMALGGGTLAGSGVYPGFAFSLELVDGTSIDLTEVIEYFLGQQPDIPALEVVVLEIQVDPTDQAYSGSLAVDTNWSIPIGSTTLSIEDIAFSLNYAAGQATGQLQGAMSIAGTNVSAIWNLPGDLQVSGSLPPMSLSRLVDALSPTSLRGDFPSITLTNTDFYIEQQKNGGFYLAAGTTVANFGAFQVNFRDVSGQTGWVIGFVLEDGWSLTNVSSAFAPLSFIQLQKASLAYATMNDPNFAFRSFTDPTRLFPPQLPSAPTGAQQGFSLYAELQLVGGPLGAIAKVLPGVQTLLLAATFPDSYAATSFEAAYQGHLTIIPGGIVFNDASVRFSAGQADFELALDATFTIKSDSITLNGVILVASGAVTLELRTTTPWHNPFGIDKLTIDEMAVSMALGDELTLTLAGMIAIGQGSSQVTLEAAVEFNTADEGLPDVLLAEETGTITLAQIVDTFTVTPMPALLDEVSLTNFQLIVVANELGWNNPLDNKHYDFGLAFGGSVTLFGLEAAFALQVQASRGVFASGQLDRPLTIGPLTIANATYPQQGPYVDLNTANSPYVNLSAAISIYEIASAKVEAEVDSEGFHFDFSAAVAGLGEMTLAIALADRTSFTLAATLSLSLHNVGPIKAGSFDLGTLKVDLALNAHFSIAATTSGSFSLSIGATFIFEGVSLRLDDLTINEQITAFSQLPKIFADTLATLLWDIAKSLLQDADALFQLIGRGVIAITDDITRILNHELGVAMQKAAALLKSVSAAVGYDATKVASLLKSGFEAIDSDVAAAMRDAAYAVTDVADAVAGAFSEGAEDVANALKAAGYALAEVTTALKDTFGYAAQQVSTFFKDSWHEADTAVHDALQTAGYLATDIDNAMKAVFDWVDHVVDKAKKALNPKNW